MSIASGMTLSEEEATRRDYLWGGEIVRARTPDEPHTRGLELFAYFLREIYPSTAYTIRTE